LGLASETPAPVTPSLLATFARSHPDVEVTAVESYGGTLLRDLRDGRLDAVIAPSLFGSAELRSVRLGSEPWVLLVGRGHRLWMPGPVDVGELRGESLVVTGHRDGSGYDRLVAEVLSAADLAPEFVHGGPGPALHTAVLAGEAVALTTAAAQVDGELLVRPLDPVRRIRFALLSRDETPAPAVRELVKIAEATVAPVRQPNRHALAAVA
jgi:DNA-binding transcriptional LysR family regulator